MNPNHHPSDSLLIAYGAGSLTEGLALVVASHLSLCTECRRKAQQVDALGGSLLEEMTPSALSADALDSVLSRLDEPVPVAAPKPRRAIAQVAGLSRLPSALKPYLEDLPDQSWRFLAPGIRQIELLPRKQGAAARLLRIAPGTTLPHHGHGGSELTLVLDGSFSDEIGRFQSGDLAELDVETRHQPIADSDEDCICLIATTAPLRFTGMLGKLVQPLIGI